MKIDASSDGPIWALGTMSGSSLDGVEAALLKTNGQDIVAFGDTAYRAYSISERAIIAAAMGRWPGDPGVESAAEVVETAHAELLTDCLSRCEADVIGFHGQTLAHDPDGRTTAGPRTHQAGDGALLAKLLNRPVVWDFRTADVQLGGQGRPLSPFFFHACARWAQLEGPVAFLDLGDTATLTWLEPECPVEEACISFDTGPALAQIENYMRLQGMVSEDQVERPFWDAGLDNLGTPDRATVASVLAGPYFHKMPPKFLCPGDFSSAVRIPNDLAAQDAVATLIAISVACVARGLELCPSPPTRVFVKGNGRRSTAFMRGLVNALPCPVEPVEAIRLDGDRLFAQAFAYLAVRVARGLPTSSPGTTGVAAAVGSGRVSTSA